MTEKTTREKLLTAAEAAKMLGVCPSTILRECHRGGLEAVWGGIRQNIIKGIKPESVEAILKARAK